MCSVHPHTVLCVELEQCVQSTHRLVIRQCCVVLHCIVLCTELEQCVQSIHVLCTGTGVVCSVNPCVVYRDWSSVFSPPIILPSDRDLQGTLEGQFEDLNDAGLDAHTS